jgi:hypothetical protein
MPKRTLKTMRVPTPIMGDDAWIEVREPTWGEAEELIKAGQEGDIALLGDRIAKFLMSWNWVEDDGSPLPLPAQDPSVLRRLQVSEVRAIVEAVGRTYAPPKA